MSLVEITPETHDVLIDLYYADCRNFTGQPVYKQAHCYLLKEAEQQLNQAIICARALGLRFKIFDAYRPPQAQFILWNHTPDPDFLANPYKEGSAHSRGAAVDLTLVDGDTELDMGTAFDAFTPLSWHRCIDVSVTAQRHRLLLLGLMTAAGFDWYSHEWWHYSLYNAKTRPLIDDATLGAHRLMDKNE